MTDIVEIIKAAIIEEMLCIAIAAKKWQIIFKIKVAIAIAVVATTLIMEGSHLRRLHYLNLHIKECRVLQNFLIITLSFFEVEFAIFLEIPINYHQEDSFGLVQSMYLTLLICFSFQSSFILISLLDWY